GQEFLHRPPSGFAHDVPDKKQFHKKEFRAMNGQLNRLNKSAQVGDHWERILKLPRRHSQKPAPFSRTPKSLVRTGWWVQFRDVAVAIHSRRHSSQGPEMVCECTLITEPKHQRNLPNCAPGVRQLVNGPLNPGSKNE